MQRLLPFFLSASAAAADTAAAVDALATKGMATAPRAGLSREHTLSAVDSLMSVYLGFKPAGPAHIGGVAAFGVEEPLLPPPKQIGCIDPLLMSDGKETPSPGWDPLVEKKDKYACMTQKTGEIFYHLDESCLELPDPLTFEFEYKSVSNPKPSEWWAWGGVSLFESQSKKEPVELMFVGSDKFWKYTLGLDTTGKIFGAANTLSYTDFIKEGSEDAFLGGKRSGGVRATDTEPKDQAAVKYSSLEGVKIMITYTDGKVIASATTKSGVVYKADIDKSKEFAKLNVQKLKPGSIRLGGMLDICIVKDSLKLF